MSDREHHHSKANCDNQMPESEGLRSEAPPPLQLFASPVAPPNGSGTDKSSENAHAPLQMQQGEDARPEGFAPYEALGVARDAPAEGEAPEDSGGAYLRETPDATDETTVIRRIPYQEQFFIQAQSDTWYQVRTLDGYEGFVTKHLVSVNGANTMGFAVHLIRAGETAQGIARKYFNGDDGRAEFIPNELDYAKAIWAYNTQHYGEETGIAQSGEQIYSLTEGVTIWIPSTDWAYRYVKDLPHDERHGDSWSRWVYEYVTYDNPLVGSVRESLESLAEEWNPAHAQAVMEVIKEHLQSGRDTMITVMDKVPAFAQFIVPGGPVAPVFANFSISFLIGALDQATNTPPEVLQQVLKSYLTAAIDPEFYIGLIEGAVTGIGNWFTDIWDVISMIGEFAGTAAQTVFSADTYTEDIPELAQAIAQALPEVAEFIQSIEISEIFAAMHDTAATMGEQMGASAFSAILGHLGNSPFGQGFSSGKIMGYLVPEIILAVGTEGIGTAIKGALTGLKGLKTAMTAFSKVGATAFRAARGMILKVMEMAYAMIRSGSKKAQAFGEKFAELLRKLLRIANGGRGRGVWDLPPFERGRALEMRFPINLPANYPVIDYFRRGVAASVKSVDLLADTYQTPAKLNAVIRKHVRKVSDFNGYRQWGFADEILPSQISGRKLDLVIPSGASPQQMEVVQNAVAYGRSLPNPVDVVIHVVAQ